MIIARSCAQTARYDPPHADDAKAQGCVGMNPTWTVRVGRTPNGIASVRTKAHGLEIGQALDFGAKAPAPSALETFLGAFGADLLLRFSDRCERARLPIDQIEARVDGTLGNALVALGVIGEEGEPGLATATVVLTVASPSSESELRAVWDDVLARSPLIATLNRATHLTCEMRLL